MIPAVTFTLGFSFISSAGCMLIFSNWVGVVVHTCKPNALEAEGGELRVRGQPGLYSKTLLLKKKKKRKERKEGGREKKRSG
jgi:hypothetical protein